MTELPIPTDPHYLGQPAPKHPAKFSAGFIEIFRELLGNWLPRPWKYDTPLVLDPFAGVGTIHQLRPQFATFGLEIEQEWADCSEFTYCADSTQMSEYWTGMFQAIVTSPTYGNRMADHHNAKDASKRNTYKHTLGHDLQPNNTGQMQFGQYGYYSIHEKVYKECRRVLEAGGLFILNVSDHIRQGERIEVCKWHAGILKSLDFELMFEHPVVTQRLGFGANGNLRVPNEVIYVFRKGPWSVTKPTI